MYTYIHIYIYIYTYIHICNDAIILEVGGVQGPMPLAPGESFSVAALGGDHYICIYTSLSLYK